MPHISLDHSPEYSDLPPAGADADVAAPGVQESPDDPKPAPRAKRPSELPGASVAPAEGQLLTVAQAALSLGVSPRRVRALVSRGWLKARAVNPRLLLIKRSDLKYVAFRSPGRPKS